MSAVEDAKRCIEGLNEWQGREGETDVSMLTVALEAQAHATLALVEQQRRANQSRLHKAAKERRANAKRGGKR